MKNCLRQATFEECSDKGIARNLDGPHPHASMVGRHNIYLHEQRLARQSDMHGEEWQNAKMMLCCRGHRKRGANPPCKQRSRPYYQLWR